MSKLDFGTLEPIEERFQLGGKSYVLREPSEAATMTWFEAMDRAKASLEADRASVGLQAPLVAACLFEVTGEERKPVTVEFVRSLPLRVVVAMFGWLTEHGGISVRSEDQVKNSPAGTPATSG